MDYPNKRARSKTFYKKSALILQATSLKSIPSKDKFIKQFRGENER